MTWKQIVEPLHPCALPNIFDSPEIGSGSIWQCPDCGRERMLLRAGGGAQWVAPTMVEAIVFKRGREGVSYRDTPTT